MTAHINGYETGTCPPIEVRHRMFIARERAGYNQHQIAEVIGITRNQVANIESGRTAPKKLIVNAWSMACGVPASWLWTGQTPPDDPAGQVRTTDYKPVTRAAS